MLRDENGKWSTTRLALITMIGAFWVGLFVPVPDQAWMIIQSTILLCLGGTAVRTTVKNLEK